MTSRTGGTRSSGRRMPQEAASGRPLKTRCEHCFLVAPSRTQSRKNLGGIDRRRLRASGEAKKTSKLPKPSPESPSPPAPGRELFDSPLGVGTDGEEGEISAESFDVEAFLPESYAAGTLSALSSPMNAGVQFTPSRRRG